MKSTIALALLAGAAAVNHPLRGNDMSLRFAEVSAPLPITAAFEGCTKDALATAAAKKALDAACKATPGCETARDALKAGQSGLAGYDQFMESGDGKAAVAEAAEKAGKEYLEGKDPLRGGTNWLANTFQLLSPSIMRQCVVCVLGLPKHQFSKFMEAGADGWTDQQICTIKDVATVGLIKGASSKKMKLMLAWSQTIAGKLQTTAKMDGTLAKQRIEAKGKIDQLTAEQITAEVVFSQLGAEVKAAREYWSNTDFVGKDAACKLDNPGCTDFAGHAWKGGTCS